MPSEKEDDKKKNKKKAKAPQRKKDEPPPKPIKWAEAPKEPGPNSLDLMRQCAEDLAQNVFPMNIRQD